MTAPGKISFLGARKRLTSVDKRPVAATGRMAALDPLPLVAKDQNPCEVASQHGAKRSVKGVAARQKKRLNLLQQV
jgi:hypothetical protein